MVIIKMYLMATCVSCFRKAHSLCFFRCAWLFGRLMKADEMGWLIGFRFVSEASGAAAFPFRRVLFTFRVLCHGNFFRNKMTCFTWNQIDVLRRSFVFYVGIKYILTGKPYLRFPFNF